MSRKKLHEIVEYKITHKEQQEAWDNACEYLNNIHNKKKPYWLTLAGNCGVGKTMLARGIVKASEIVHAQTWRWATAVNKYMRAGDYGIVDHLCDLRLLLIDDVGSEHMSDYTNKELLRVLENRLDKWTIITTNKTMDEISDTVDMRISSRLKRGRNVVVNMFNVKDFADI